MAVRLIMSMISRQHQDDPLVYWYIRDEYVLLTYLLTLVVVYPQMIKPPHTFNLRSRRSVVPRDTEGSLPGADHSFFRTEHSELKLYYYNGKKRNQYHMVHRLNNDVKTNTADELGSRQSI